MKIILGIISIFGIGCCLLYIIQSMLFNIKEGKLIKYLEIHNKTINRNLSNSGYELILANYLGNTPTMIFLESKKENNQNVYSGDLSLEEICILVKKLKEHDITPEDFIENFRSGEESRKDRNKAKENRIIKKVEEKILK